LHGLAAKRGKEEGVAAILPEQADGGGDQREQGDQG